MGNYRLTFVLRVLAACTREFRREQRLGATMADDKMVSSKKFAASSESNCSIYASPILDLRTISPTIAAFSALSYHQRLTV